MFYSYHSNNSGGLQSVKDKISSSFPYDERLNFVTFKTIAKIKRININYNPQIFPAKRCDSTIKKSQSNKPFYSLFLVAIKMLVDHKFLLGFYYSFLVMMFFDLRHN